MTEGMLMNLGVYFLAMNILTFGVFGVDKYKAIKKKHRIPEKK